MGSRRAFFDGPGYPAPTYMPTPPPMASMLLAREVPPRGGDTLFANMYLAYETLSAGMKRLVAPPKAVHASAHADVTRTREDRGKSDGAQAKKAIRPAHPGGHPHPRDGRHTL